MSSRAPDKLAPQKFAKSVLASPRRAFRNTAPEKSLPPSEAYRSPVPSKKRGSGATFQVATPASLPTFLPGIQAWRAGAPVPRRPWKIAGLLAEDHQGGGACFSVRINPDSLKGRSTRGF